MIIFRRCRSALACMAALGCALLLSAGCARQAASSGGSTVSVGDADGSLSASTENMDFSYTDNDLDASYDEANATRITLSGDAVTVDGTGASVSGTTVTITGGGTYLLSGTLDNGRVIVDADGQKLWLVLDGAAIRCQSGPGALYIRSADKVFLLLAPGSENSLADSEGDDLAAEESNVDAALFSKADLTINGTGSLTVTGAAHGIVCKDELVFTDGVLTVDAAADGIQGKDSVKIRAGTLHITASDDGINGAGGADGSALGGRPGQNGFGSGNSSLRIADGYIVVDASGDGIDVNGSLSIEGGTVLVTGPSDSGNGAFDYDGSATVSGGVVICVGASGMAQGFSDTSAQPSAMVTLSTRGAAGETVALTDADGNVLAAFTPTRTWQTAVISAPGMTVGGTYTLYTGGSLSAANDDGFADSGTLTGGTAAQTFTLSSVSTTVGSAGGMNPGGGGMNPGGGMGGFGR